MGPESLPGQKVSQSRIAQLLPSSKALKHAINSERLKLIALDSDDVHVTCGFIRHGQDVAAFKSSTCSESVVYACLRGLFIQSRAY